MPKKFTAVLLLLLVYTSIFSQDGLTLFAKSYFKTDPFAGAFSNFVQTLLKDSSIHNKQIRHRTDTTLYYFAGNYNRYSRVFFKPSRVDIVLEQLPINKPNPQLTDTILVYRLLVYTDTTLTGGQEVKKEFSRIHRQFHRKFNKSEFQEIQSDGQKTGGLYNYFIPPAMIAPVSIA